MIGVADDRSIVGIERDQLDSDDKFMRHLTQVVRKGLGDRAGTCIDPKTQVVQGKTVCVVSWQRSPEPVYLKWNGMEKTAEGDFFVRSGPGVPVWHAVAGRNGSAWRIAVRLVFNRFAVLVSTPCQD